MEWMVIAPCFCGSLKIEGFGVILIAGLGCAKETFSVTLHLLFSLLSGLQMITTTYVITCPHDSVVLTLLQ